MVLKEHYDEALGDQANDITRAIQDGEGRVLVVHDLAQISDRDNSFDCCDILRHDLVCSDILLALWAVIPQQGDVLRSQSDLIQTSIKVVAHRDRDKYAKHDWNEKVNRLCRLQHYHAQRVCKSRVSSQHG